MKGFNNYLPHAAGCDALNAIWHAAGDLCCQGTLWLTFSLLSSRTWRSFSAERLPSQPVFQHETWHVVLPSQTQALHFSLICFIMLSLAHSSSLYKLLWMASLPLSVSTHTSSSTRFQYLLEARALWFLPVTSANQLVLAPAAETFLNVNSLPPRHSSEHQLVRYLKWDSENSETQMVNTWLNVCF